MFLKILLLVLDYKNSTFYNFFNIIDILKLNKKIFFLFYFIAKEIKNLARRITLLYSLFISIAIITDSGHLTFYRVG